MVHLTEKLYEEADRKWPMGNWNLSDCISLFLSIKSMYVCGKRCQIEVKLVLGS